MKLKKLSIALVVAFMSVSVILLVGILILGGPNLLGYLKVTLIQGFGLGIAVTASLFFIMRLVWRLKAVPMGIAMVLFVVGIGMFVSVSMGRMYALQYPVFVSSFGPGHGPGLPLANVIQFFKNIDNFEYIEDIARDPNDVPAPIKIKAEEEDIVVHDTSVVMSDTEDSAVEALDGEMLGGAEVFTEVEEDVQPDLGREIVKLNLETVEVLSEIAPGIIFNYWTFNRTVPGPLFRVQEGDIVEVAITNSADSLHPHNIDFHAATGPGGGGAVSIVAPGETKTFRYKAMNPGLFVYHCAVPNMAVHMTHGMYGMIIVEPKEGLPAVDKEFYVMQGELYTTGALGRTGLQIFDAKKMMDGIPEYVTFNGRPGGLMGKMEAEVGDKIRMFVGNGGVAHNSSFHVVGEIFDTVYPEASIGGALFHNVQTTNVPAGGATIVEFTVDYPGNYVLVDHALMRTDKGAWGVLTVTGEADPTIFDGDFSAPAEHKH
jgi:nitrite reductase (NO-forming)